MSALPNDGTKVSAMTYESIEYDRESEEVVGTLITHPSPFGLPQCWVNGVQVDSSTIEVIEVDISNQDNLSEDEKGTVVHPREIASDTSRIDLD